MMASQVPHGAVALTVVSVDRCLDDDSARLTSLDERGVDISNPNAHRVGDPSRLWWGAVGACIGNDHGPVAVQSQLGSMSLADASALDKAEGICQERHRGPHVWVHQDGHDHRRWY